MSEYRKITLRHFPPQLITHNLKSCPIKWEKDQHQPKFYVVQSIVLQTPTYSDRPPKGVVFLIVYILGMVVWYNQTHTHPNAVSVVLSIAFVLSQFRTSPGFWRKENDSINFHYSHNALLLWRPGVLLLAVGREVVVVVSEHRVDFRWGEAPPGRVTQRGWPRTSKTFPQFRSYLSRYISLL